MLNCFGMTNVRIKLKLFNNLLQVPDRISPNRAASKKEPRPHKKNRRLSRRIFINDGFNQCLGSE